MTAHSLTGEHIPGATGFPAIRTISVYATTEAEARSRLARLPLVFLSRCPVQGGAA